MHVHWNWKKLVFAAGVLAASGLGGFFAVRTTATVEADEKVAHPSRANEPATANDEKAIRSMQAAYVKAFNAGDAKALAAFWAVDGEFVDADGHTFRGRSAIEKEFVSFFAESKGLTLEVTTDSLRFVSPDVALESGSSRVKGAADGSGSRTSYSIVHTKRDGQWLLASVRETPYAPSSNYDRLSDLEWMVGNWTAKSGNRTMDLNCEWTANRNFLIRKYSFKNGDEAAKSGIQVIGWDPVAGAIRSWAFDCDGGFGSERWTKDGQRWIQEATCVSRDGGQFVATNIITRLDHDDFTWQSVRRSLNQAQLPDTAPIKATRVKR